MTMQDRISAPAGDTLLAGATGLVGQAFVTRWRGPGRLHLLVRRPPPEPLPATPHAVHRVDFAALPALPPATDAVCCLGTTIAVAGSAEAFRAVDLDAVVAFARAAKAAGVRRFAVVSAIGADARSRHLYSRTKGKMESALRTLGFDTLLIARPSLLAGHRAALGQPPRRAETAALALSRPLRGLLPLAWRPIDADVVARALQRALREAQAGPPQGVRVLSSAEMQAMGSEPGMEVQRPAP